MYSCPSGNRCRTRWAQCTAKAVLPTPAVPDTAEITTAVRCRSSRVEKGVELTQGAGTPDEAGHVGRQLGWPGRGRWWWHVRCPVRGLAELVPVRTDEAERIGEQPHRHWSRRGDLTRLNLAQTAHSDAAPVGQVLLAEAQPAPMLAQDVTEHAPSLPSGPRTPMVPARKCR